VLGEQCGLLLWIGQCGGLHVSPDVQNLLEGLEALGADVPTVGRVEVGTGRDRPFVAAG
jgi:hypothetical protein